MTSMGTGSVAGSEAAGAGGVDGRSGAVGGFGDEGLAGFGEVVLVDEEVDGAGQRRRVAPQSQIFEAFGGEIEGQFATLAGLAGTGHEVFSLDFRRFRTIPSFLGDTGWKVPDWCIIWGRKTKGKAREGRGKCCIIN